MELKIGDRVKVLKEYDGNENIVGKVGTIRTINLYNNFYVAVDFDDYIEGHTSHDGKMGHRWCIPNSKEYIEKIETKKIVIETDGKITTATLIENGEKKTATAKFNEANEFDFETDARLAFEILFNTIKKEKTIEVGDKVKIIDTGECYITYPDWIEKNAKSYGIRYAYGNIPTENETKETFVVIAKAKHLIKSQTTLCLISKSEGWGACYLIEEQGIKKE